MSISFGAQGKRGEAGVRLIAAISYRSLRRLSVGAGTRLVRGGEVQYERMCGLV